MNESGKYDSFTFGSPKIMIKDGDGNLIEFDGTDPINFDTEDKVVFNGADEFDDPIPFDEIQVFNFAEPYDPELEIDINLEGGRMITGYIKRSNKVAFERGETEELQIRPGESAEVYLAEMGLDKGILKLRKNKLRESDFE